MFEKLFGWANRIALVAAWAGGCMVVFASFMVTIDVFMRKFLGITLGGADEISGYLFAIATTWALPYTVMCRANVRIDALYVYLSRTFRALLDLFGAALLGLFAACLTWRAIALVGASHAMGARSVTPLHVPLVLPQAFWVVGWIMFVLCLALVVWGIAHALLRGDFRKVHRLGGALSIEEEIEEEIGAKPTFKGEHEC
jgi:TRAP-type mannitol/chloroaromatic compound transport system permease small subunit